MSPDIVVIVRWLYTSLAIVGSPPTDRLFTVFHATALLTDDFHPISIVFRMLTLWALLTEISCVTVLWLRLAVWGS